MPSLYEGFSLPAVEHMASGTPLVASRTGALPEVTGDAALLVTPGDAEELAAALRGLHDSPAERDRLSAAAWQRVQERFTWSAVARATVAEYERAIAARRRPGSGQRRDRPANWPAPGPDRREQASQAAGLSRGVRSADRRLRRFPVGPGDRVLDLGCGGGRHAFEALRRGADVVACDADAGRAAEGGGHVRPPCTRPGRRRPRRTPGRWPETAPPCRSAATVFDRVIAAEVLEHIADDQAALNEIARVLRPGRPAGGHRAGLAAGADLLAAVGRLPQRPRRPRPHLHPARAGGQAAGGRG